MIGTNESGIACCGNCGGELAIVCSSNCAEPDVVFRKNYIASLPKRPRGKAPKVARYPPPTQCWCGDPVAKRVKHGVGRPPTKCEKHLKRKVQA